MKTDTDERDRRRGRGRNRVLFARSVVKGRGEVVSASKEVVPSFLSKKRGGGRICMELKRSKSDDHRIRV